MYCHLRRSVYPIRKVDIIIICLVIAFSVTAKAQQGFPAIPVISFDDFSKISSADYTNYAKLKSAGYTPTCLSNGLIGISPGPNPIMGTMNKLNKASTVVNGFVHNNEMKEYEELAPAPYPLGIDISVNGTSLRSNLELLQTINQTLNMNNGELTTSMNFAASAGTKIKIDVVQFASRFIPSVICEKVTLTSNKDISLLFSTHIDTLNTGVRETGEQKRELTETTQAGVANVVDQVKEFTTNSGSKLGIALLLQRAPNLTFKQVGNYDVALKAGQPYDIKFLASMVSDLYHPQPHLECIRLVRWAEMVGYDNLQAENRKIWNELWKSRIKVTGASPFEQQALDVAFYYLQSNIHASSKLGFPPFGMTQSWAYYGHNFWDMDLWTMIPTLLVQPNAAKSMVSYRYEGLEAAKNKAALFGYRGAQYPWEASRVGWEVTPSAAETGWAEQHTIGPAIAGWQYYLATGDKLFLKDKVWPIMREVSTWIESRGEFTKRGFEFKYMMGHDEWISNVSNSSYFNLLAKMVMTSTIDCANELQIEYPETWKRIANQIFIPTDSSHTIVYPFDLTSKVRVFDPEKNQYFDEMPSIGSRSYTLGNLNALFVHNLPLSDSIIRGTYLAEEKIRASRSASQSVPGTSKSPSFVFPSLLSISVFCGENEHSHRLFDDSWKNFWLAPYGMVKEYQSQDYGSYITAFGSLLQNVMIGLTGLRLEKGSWAKYDAKLPSGWSQIEIDQIWIKGRSYKIIAMNNKKTQLIENK